MSTNLDESAILPLLEQFTNRAEPVGTIVKRVDNSTLAANVIAEIAQLIGTTQIAISGEAHLAAPQLVAALEQHGLTMWTPVGAIDARDAPLGLSFAHLGIAETGSLLLAEPNLGDRAVGLVSLTQITICATRSIVPSLDEVADVLRDVALGANGGYATLVTGPSRTADIEMSLTVGVQGPGKVYTLLIDDLQ